MAKKANRAKQPYVAGPDQVTIRRHTDGVTAIIEYAEDGVMTTNLTIGPELAEMTDREILDLHNECVQAQVESRQTYEHVAVEIPMGGKQIEYHDRSEQWTPRGGVLRVIVSDDEDEHGAPSFIIDDMELSLREFGRLLHTWNGWGIRITLVPEDELYEEPPVEVREPERDET